jgi:hypothetical protein
MLTGLERVYFNLGERNFVEIACYCGRCGVAASGGHIGFKPLLIGRSVAQKSAKTSA